MKVVRSLPLRTGRLYPQEFSWYLFLEAVNPRAHGSVGNFGKNPQRVCCSISEFCVDSLRNVSKNFKKPSRDVYCRATGLMSGLRMFRGGEFSYCVLTDCDSVHSGNWYGCFGDIYFHFQSLCWWTHYVHVRHTRCQNSGRLRVFRKLCT
jgi:hypothetical protein